MQVKVIVSYKSLISLLEEKVEALTFQKGLNIPVQDGKIQEKEARKTVSRGGLESQEGEVEG